MFSTMQECQDIVSLMTDSVDVKVYCPEDKNDEYLSDLTFEQFFGCYYISDDLSFEIFAYTFPSEQYAVNYFAYVTGKNNVPNPSFSDNTGLKSFRRIVVCENKAYALYCQKADKEKAVDFINGIFSDKIL